MKSRKNKKFTKKEQRLYQEANRKRAEQFLTPEQYNQIERIKMMFDLEGIIDDDKNIVGNALMIYLWTRDNEQEPLMTNSINHDYIEKIANKYCDPKPVFKGMLFEEFLDFFKIRIRRISPTETLN